MSRQRQFVSRRVARDRKSAAHNRVGLRGLGAQQYALGAHSTKTRVTKEFCCDREFSIVIDFTQLFCRNKLVTTMLSRQSSSHVTTENSMTWDFPCRDSVARMAGLACRCWVHTTSKCARRRPLPRTTGPGS